MNWTAQAQVNTARLFMRDSLEIGTIVTYGPGRATSFCGALAHGDSIHIAAEQDTFAISLKEFLDQRFAGITDNVWTLRRVDTLTFRLADHQEQGGSVILAAAGGLSLQVEGTYRRLKVLRSGGLFAEHPAGEAVSLYVEPRDTSNSFLLMLSFANVKISRKQLRPCGSSRVYALAIDSVQWVDVYLRGPHQHQFGLNLSSGNDGRSHEVLPFTALTVSEGTAASLEQVDSARLSLGIEARDVGYEHDFFVRSGNGFVVHFDTRNGLELNTWSDDARLTGVPVTPARWRTAPVELLVAAVVLLGGVFGYLGKIVLEL